MKNFSLLILGIIVFFSCNQTDSKSNKGTGNATDYYKPSSELLTNDTVFSFENYETNNFPINWAQGFTGKGKGTDWKIVDDNGNKVLAQLSSDNPNYHFNVIVFDDISAKNMDLKVNLKGVAGNMDQGGGFVWRFSDMDNYYVVRANPLEDNVVLYKVINGKRTDLPVLGKGRTYGVDVEKLGSGWNTLSLRVEDDLFTVYLNDKELFQVKDESITTEGKIGLWTKADAVTYFDDLRVSH